MTEKFRAKSATTPLTVPVPLFAVFFPKWNWISAKWNWIYSQWNWIS